MQQKHHRSVRLKADDIQAAPREDVAGLISVGRWRATLEAYGFATSEVDRLLFLKWLHLQTIVNEG